MDDVFPDRSMEHREKLAWMIEQDGWAMEPVMPQANADPPVPGYSYTVGLESTYEFPRGVRVRPHPRGRSGAHRPDR